MALPMNPRSILWPELNADVILIEPDHPGAGRYVPPPFEPKLPDGNYAPDPDNDNDPMDDFNYVGSRHHY